MTDTEIKISNNIVLIEYKGHQGTVELDIDDNIIYGHLICPHVISGYDGKTLQEFTEAFKDAVNNAIEQGWFN